MEGHVHFKRTLLTEVNVVSAQLHLNSWAFVRAYAILCYSLDLSPSVDSFLYFFEVKDPEKKLWVSFNGVAGRVLSCRYGLQQRQKEEVG